MNDQTDFYVGYLPLPLPVRNRLIRMITTISILILGSAVSIAIFQRNPGNGKWEIDQLSDISGVIRFNPYPVLVTDQPSFRTIILVDDGKFGADSRLFNLKNKRAILAGHVIQRGNLFLLELDPDHPVKESGETVPVADTENSHNPVELIGEIIDPKCFAGAMKPGEGKTHKSCAILCLRGGIPPVFLDQSGRLLVITSPDGHALAEDKLEEIIAYVGDLVSINGVMLKVGNQLQLRINPKSIRRM